MTINTGNHSDNYHGCGCGFIRYGEALTRPLVALNSRTGNRRHPFAETIHSTRRSFLL